MIKPYIEMNTKLRTEAKNDFEKVRRTEAKNDFKLINNVVVGKTMEMKESIEILNQ